MYKIILILYLSTINFTSGSNNISEVRQYLKSSEEDGRVDTIWNELQRTCAKHAKDCTEFKKYNKKSGVYKIFSGNSEDLKVYCDMTNDEWWLIIQRHYDETVDFKRTWSEYEKEFGNVEGEYWFDLTDNKNEKKYAAYKQFSIRDAVSKYKLRVGRYSGNAGDSMKYQNEMMFSATDQDNDKNSGECAKSGEPWWYDNCTWSALNRKFSSNLNWHTFSNHTAKTSIMMIRRI